MMKKLLLGVALLLAFNVFAAEEKSLYDYVPDEAGFIYWFNMEKINALPLYNEILKATNFDSEFRRQFKINLADLQEFISYDEVSFSVPNILLLRGKIDEKIVLERLKTDNITPQIKQLGSEKIYSAKRFNYGMFFCFPEPGLLLLGDKNSDFEKYLEARKKGLKKATLPRPHNADALAELYIIPQKYSDMSAENKQHFADLKFIYIAITCAGKENRDLTISTEIECESPESAKVMASRAKLFIMGYGGVFLRNTPELMLKIVESTIIETKDKSVTVKIHLPEAVVEEIKNAILETSNTRNKSGNQPEESNLNKHQKAAAAPAA